MKTETFTMRVNFFLLVWIAASLWPLRCMADTEETVDSGGQYSKQMFTIIIIFVVILCFLIIVAFLTGLCCSNRFRTPTTMDDQEMGLMVAYTALNYIVQSYFVQVLSVNDDSKKIGRRKIELVNLL